MNKTISVRMMEPVRVRTQDSRYDDDSTFDDVVDGIEARLGLLAPGGIVALKAVLAQYGGGGDTTTTGVTTPTGDAARDFGRTQGAKVRREMEHNARISKARTDFWEARNAELAASIRR